MPINQCWMVLQNRTWSYHFQGTTEIYLFIYLSGKHFKASSVPIVFSPKFIFFCNFLKHRTVTLHRQPVGGLGLSIKVWKESSFFSYFLVWLVCFSLDCGLTTNMHLLQGGAEHKVPVVISKMFKDQAGKIYISVIYTYSTVVYMISF